MASIGCVGIQNQLATLSGYAFGVDDSTSKSKVHLQRSSTSRFARSILAHLSPITPILQTQAP
jgi:hypothetical protein